jgi:hypothetical protein
MIPAVPPPVLEGALLIAYAVVDATIAHTGVSTLHVDGKQIRVVPYLAIAQQQSGQVLLLFCDEQWNAIGVVGCSDALSAEGLRRRFNNYLPLRRLVFVTPALGIFTRKYIRLNDFVARGNPGPVDTWR